MSIDIRSNSKTSVSVSAKNETFWYRTNNIITGDASEVNVKHETIENVRAWRKRFHALQGLDAETKQRLLALVLHHKVRASSQNIIRRRVLLTIFGYIVYVLLLASFGISFVFHKYEEIFLGGISTMMLATSLFMGFFMSVMASKAISPEELFLVLEGAVRRGLYRGIFPFAFLLGLGISSYPHILPRIIALVHLHIPLNNFLFWLLWQLGTSCLIAWWCVWLSIIIAATIDKRFCARRNAAHPQAVVVDEYLQILEWINFPSTKTKPFSHHISITRSLDKIANCIEKDWPRSEQLRSLHLQTRREDLAQRMAHAIRSLSMWVLTPQATTREDFRKRIVEDLTHVAQGNWGMLATEDAIPLTPRGVWNTVRSWFPRLVFGALFLLTIWRPSGVEATWLQYRGLLLPAAYVLLMFTSPSDSALSKILPSVKDSFHIGQGKK